MKKILVTGAAGFIGYHVCEKLLSMGFQVYGLDNINDYYDVNLKIARLKNLGISIDKDAEFTLEIISDYHPKFKFIKLNLENRIVMNELFNKEKFDVVCNLAAQAGVRYSLEKPFTYIESNIEGFLNVLENCRNHKINKLVYASSSSVYGLNEKTPFSTEDNVDNPISLYAATKKANELMAHTYSHLFNIQTIGLRFFTVYGPWGRPDMAMSLFTDAILNDKPIKVFNNGELSRDFTYIDDIVDGVIATLINHNFNLPLYSIYNIGNSKPVKLMDFITEIENFTNKKAIKKMLSMQPGDVEKTWADILKFKEDFNYSPNIDIKQGVSAYINWYMDYYMNGK